MRKFILSLACICSLNAAYSEDSIIDLYFVNDTKESIDFGLSVISGGIDASNKHEDSIERANIGKIIRAVRVYNFSRINTTMLNNYNYYLAGQKSPPYQYLQRSGYKDYISFYVLKKSDGKVYRLHQKLVGGYCNLDEKDSPTIYKYTGDKLYVIPNSTSECSFTLVEDGYPQPESRGGDTNLLSSSPPLVITPDNPTGDLNNSVSNLTNSTENVTNNTDSSNKVTYLDQSDTSIDAEDGKANFQIELQKNPDLEQQLDDEYFAITGVHRAKA
ncbi:hypothetical protein IB642_04355 [Allofrancisella guangzhouensis]|uniref:Uncharacterized protein n=1 Tax=Allofrancisella guangzhouensis TaxID=594679 RepID=A0A0A8EBB2_9GAMM|nr:hypothetical protein [Allofrancisella guangzhouensis]AJC49451.1 hypothetical protein SD28_07385 [Allofrancisella guangzhouensis]MBK2026745.1 hypothetical protein [Allofrancisella guangzhouensis]MBK2044250.1 hypothetical protein [Allofrancisella guangzhouensis]MBK2046175.1 hypothetical protein [Allofrancisella guangzhouensis]